MAYAAMTPGYLITVAIITGTSFGFYAAHAQIVAAVGQTSVATDEFTVGLVVTLLASAGMAVVVRVATDAESRRRDSRHAVASGWTCSSGSIGSSRGSTARKPVREVIQAVVDDIAASSRSRSSRCTCRPAATS